MSRHNSIAYVGLVLVLGLAVANAIDICATERFAYYLTHPGCKPSYVKEPGSATCLGISKYSNGSSTWVDVGDLYTEWGTHFNVMGSRYYFARLAEALGYDCPTNNNTLYGLNIVTPWSGIHGAIAIDGSEGYKYDLLRKCVFPDLPSYPFLCTGASTSGFDGCGCGHLLGTLSYNSLLHDDNNRWNLFAHCWNAPSPAHPDSDYSEVTGVSFNVFSLDRNLTDYDKDLILAKLDEFHFDTSDFNIIYPNFD